MITFFIIYLVLYLITAFVGWNAIGPDYPDYKKPEYWEYIIVLNPFNVLIGIGFILWSIYDEKRENKRVKKREF